MTDNNGNIIYNASDCIGKGNVERQQRERKRVLRRAVLLKGAPLSRS